MKVTVKFFAAGREIAGVREENFEVQDSATVRHLLRLLADKHGKQLEEYLFDPKTGEPRPHLTFLIDGRSVSMQQSFDTVLSDGCALAIVPPVAGGS